MNDAGSTQPELDVDDARAVYSLKHWKSALFAAILFSLVGLTTVLLSDGPLRVGRFVSSPPFIVGLIFSALLGLAAGSARHERYVLIGLWASILLISAANILFSYSPIFVYGDGNILLMFLHQNIVPAKWLAGYQLINFGFRGIWLSTLWEDWMLRHVGGVDVYVSLASTLTVCLGSIALLIWNGKRLAVRLTMLTPFLFVLGVGYKEYYPFIVVPYISIVCLALLRKPEGREFWILTIVAGVLPAFYIGFIPLAGMLMLYLVTLNPRRAFVIVPTAASSFFITVFAFWRDGFASFLSDYRGNFLLDNRIPFQRYELQVAESRSIFFRPGYVLSWEHIADLGYVFFYMGLGVVPALGLFAFLLLRGELKRKRSSWMRDPRIYLAAGLCLQQMHYFFFMVPHFGPRHDIDVYFSVPLIAMLFGGILWEEALSPRSEKLRRRFSMIVYPVLLGTSAALVTILLMSGPPNVYRGMAHKIEILPEGGVVHPDEMLEALDGASIVSDEKPELFVYSTFFTTIAAEIDYAGTEAGDFRVTQHFAGAKETILCEIEVNHELVASWGGRPYAEQEESVSFMVTLVPGINRIAYSSAPVGDAMNDVSIYIGLLEFSPG